MLHGVGKLKPWDSYMYVLYNSWQGDTKPVCLPEHCLWWPHLSAAIDSLRKDNDTDTSYSFCCKNSKFFSVSLMQKFGCRPMSTSREDKLSGLCLLHTRNHFLYHTLFLNNCLFHTGRSLTSCIKFFLSSFASRSFQNGIILSNIIRQCLFGLRCMDIRSGIWYLAQFGIIWHHAVSRREFVLDMNITKSSVKQEMSWLLFIHSVTF